MIYWFRRVFLGALLLGLIGIIWAAESSTPPPPRAYVAGEKGTKPGEVRLNPQDGAEMLWAPAGEFTMGSSDAMLQIIVKEAPYARKDAFAHEQPAHKVSLDGFWIYRTEVPVQQYRAYCTATKTAMPKAPEWKWQDQQPIVNVNWDDARAYAKWAGTRLPSEAQWEYAARGTEDRIFPWGNHWDEERCNHLGNHRLQTQPVGSYPLGRTPLGLLDMAGNAWEWCLDFYAPNTYTAEPQTNPTGPLDGEQRVMRGGGWGDDVRATRCAARAGVAPGTLADSIGFRCVIIP